MQVKTPDQRTMQAVVTLLSPYCSELSPTTLVEALRSYDTRDEDIPKYLTKHEAARMLGLSWYTVVRMAKQGSLPAKKVGRQWRFPLHELERYREDTTNHE